MSSVALQDKLVLVPNGAEQYGLIGSTYAFQATSWEMSIAFTQDFSSDHAAFGKTQFQIYYLEKVPELEDKKQFAAEIYDDSVDGMVIRTVP